MNKAQKAVEQVKLDRERAVLKELQRHYEYALTGINERLRVLQSMPETQSTVYHKEYQQTMKKQVSAILENLQSNVYTSLDQYRHEAYTTGFVGTMYDLHYQGVPLLIPINRDAVLKAVQHDTKLTSPLYDALGIDTKVMTKKISKELSRGLATGLTYDEIARNIRNTTKAPLARARAIARTEGHRIQQASAADARTEAKAKGADVVKQWDSTLDGDTRPNHRQLDGQIRETDEPFEVGGYKPMHPGDFGDPAEDCNCRCVALTRARAALDEDELKTLRERAEYFGIDKSDSFTDFEKKYLKAARMLETPSDAGQLAVPYSKRGIEIEKRLQDYLQELPTAGSYIARSAGEFKSQDLAILTTETGVEYTTLTVGKQSYLIRGMKNGTTIPENLWGMLVAQKGTIDCHSHPYVGDLVPSKSDRDTLKALKWQRFSSIIEPGQKEVEFDAEGATVPVNRSIDRDDEYYSLIFGDGD